MKLANPTPVRLSHDLLRRVDAWRGDAMSRGTAIRLLLEQALAERK
jgi:metal-responsive CopG/Arc/MetJ family transcriptional regulator